MKKDKLVKLAEEYANNHFSFDCLHNSPDYIENICHCKQAFIDGFTKAKEEEEKK